MSGRLLLIPGAPLLIPELSGGDEVAANLRAAVLTAAREVISGAKSDALTESESGSFPIVFVYRPDDQFRTSHTGSFRAWGTDISVGYGNHLPELVARWVLREAGCDASFLAQAESLAQFPDPWTLDPNAVVVAIADGPAALNVDAPLSLLPHAREIDAVCSTIGGCDSSVLEFGTDPFGEFGPTTCASVGLYTAGIWQDITAFGAELYDDPTSQLSGAEKYHCDTYGVGYHVAVWHWK